MLKLQAKFQNELGHSHLWSYPEPNPDLAPEEIRNALETLTTLKIFEKDGVKMFQQVVSAKFVETIETPIFDLSKPAPEAYVADPNNMFAPQFIVADTPKVSKAREEMKEGHHEEVVESLAAPTVPVVVKPVAISPTATKVIKKAVPSVGESKVTVASTKTSLEKAVASDSANVLEGKVVSDKSVEERDAVLKSTTTTIPEEFQTKIALTVSDRSLEVTESRESDAPVKRDNSPRAQAEQVRAYHTAKKKKRSKKKKR